MGPARYGFIFFAGRSSDSEPLCPPLLNEVKSLQLDDEVAENIKRAKCLAKSWYPKDTIVIMETLFNTCEHFSKLLNL